MQQQLATPTWYDLEPEGRVLLSIRHEASALVSLPPPVIERRRTVTAGPMQVSTGSVDGKLRPIATLSVVEVGVLLASLELERYSDALQSAGFDGAKLAESCKDEGEGDSATAANDAGDDALRVAGVFTVSGLGL